MAADDQPDEAESNKHLITFIDSEAPITRIALVDVLNYSGCSLTGTNTCESSPESHPYPTFLFQSALISESLADKSFGSVADRKQNEYKLVTEPGGYAQSL